MSTKAKKLRGFYDWYPGERGRILGRYSGRKMVRDIHVKIAASIAPVGGKHKSVTQYLFELYKQGLLTGQALEDIKKVIKHGR